MIQERFIIYKGNKIYHPSKIDNTYSGQTYYQYWPPQMSSIPMSGYPTIEEYFKAKKSEIDEKIKFGTWTDYFKPLI